ncbi:MAG: rod shape-determining protein MreC [Rhodospirillaceae bacterium]|jgi:rod shape-determining protein MreC|nr:rod shape-determining protein MreC [Rhodospirillaceae bacterium]
MKRRWRDLEFLVIPIPFIRRFIFLLLIIVSIWLLLPGKIDNLENQLRAAVNDTIAPILDIMSRPIIIIADKINDLRDLIIVRSENVRLKREIINSMHWQTLARKLDNENRILRNQLNFIPNSDSSFVTARVVGDTGGAFVHSMLINSGSKDGICKNQAVISGEFLVGHITDVSKNSARILLLTDINSHIPVILSNSRALAIMTGDNSDQPRLNYLSPNMNTISTISGDLVLTSGNGNIFPPGLPIGVVSSIKNDIVRVEPFVHRHKLEYVIVTDFGLNKTIKPTISLSKGHD